jgi:hypothetical protein
MTDRLRAADFPACSRITYIQITPVMAWPVCFRLVPFSHLDEQTYKETCLISNTVVLLYGIDLIGMLKADILDIRTTVVTIWLTKTVRPGQSERVRCPPYARSGLGPTLQSAARRGYREASLIIEWIALGGHHGTLGCVRA